MLGREKRELMMHASKCYAVVFTKLCSDFKKKKKDLRSKAILSRNNENCSLEFLYLLRDDLNGSSGKGKGECKKK